MNTPQVEQDLEPCPFCGHDKPSFERRGTPRQSCIVVCGNCGCRHESSDEGLCSGQSWNDRASLPPMPAEAPAFYVRDSDVAALADKRIAGRGAMLHRQATDGCTGYVAAPAALDADKVDAERYRWLRNQGSLREIHRHRDFGKVCKLVEDIGAELLDYAIDDAAIDQARGGAANG